MKIKSFLIVSVLAVAILGFGFAASAQTTNVQALIAQLQAQIAQLLAQIKVLQAQQGTTPAWCHTFNTNMGVGSTGDDVTALYTALTKEGIISQYDSPGSVRMQFYEETASNVIKFQAKYGILQTGYVGPLTRAKLNSLYGCGTTPPATCVPNWQCQWGVCINGSQSKTPVDSNNCGQEATIDAIKACSRQIEDCAPSISQSTITSLGTNNATYGEKVAAYISNLPANFSSASMEFSGAQTGDSTATLSSDKTYLGFTVPNLTPGKYTIYASFFNATSAEIARSNSMPFTISPTSCVCNSWSDWGPCVNGYQLKSCLSTLPSTCGEQGIRQSCAPSQPSATITSPNGGETFTGSTVWIPVSFTTTNVPIGTHYDVDLIGANNQEWVLLSAQTYPENGVQSNRVEVGPSVPNGSNYKIRVYMTVNDVKVQDLSDNTFTISKNYAQSSISVISPNGGETLASGSNVVVKWSAAGAESFPGANLQLINSSGAMVSYVYVNPASGNWTTDSLKTNGVPLGQYKVKACLSGNIDICDSSDNYFSVVAP